MTLQQFITQFPEFSRTDYSLLQAHLDAAALELDVTVWQAMYDQGHGYTAAHKLALSPYGQAARLVGKDGTTTYQTHLKSLMLKVTGGYRYT